MKKILHITMSGAYGGAENIIFSIIDNLDKEYSFSYICPEGDLEDELKNRNIEYLCFDPHNLKRLSREIKRIDPDIIHTHDFRASVIASLVSKKKIISSLHTRHPWIDRFGIKSLIYLISSLKFKRVVVGDEEYRENLKIKKFISNKLEVILNTVSASRVLELSNSYEHSDPYDLCFLGRLADYKNPLQFIEIVSEVKKRFPEVRAVMIGEGELRKECEDLISELKLEDHLKLEGYLKNPYPLLKNSKILVIPSKHEGLALVAIEAMILGKPIVASKVGGLHNVIEDNGRLCGHLDEFVQEILSLLTEREGYRKKSLSSLEMSKKFTDKKDFLRRVTGLYEA